MPRLVTNLKSYSRKKINKDGQDKRFLISDLKAAARKSEIKNRKSKILRIPVNFFPLR